MQNQGAVTFVSSVGYDRDLLFRVRKEIYDHLHLADVPVPHMAGGAYRYLVFGIKPGDFMLSIFANDFIEAGLRAIGENETALVAWAKWITWYLPEACYGSRERVQNWMNMPQKEREKRLGVDLDLKRFDRLADMIELPKER